MPKKARKPTKYRCPIYKTPYEIFLGWKWDDYIAYLDDKFPDHMEPRENDVAGWCSFYHDRSLCLIFVENKANYATLAHECLHAANYTLYHRNWKPDLTNDEPQALLMSAIMRAALNDNLHFYEYSK